MKLQEISTAEARNYQMGIMDAIDAFCRENDICYSLSGGTLLGSIRHGGYIPWDDDIDIVMPRPDYDRFLRDFPGYIPHLKTDHFGINPDFISAFAKVFDDRTFTVGPNLIDDSRIFVDIFPIDGLPPQDDPVLEKEIANIVNGMRRVGKYWKYTDSPAAKFSFLIKYALKRLNSPSLKSLQNRIAEISSRYPYDSAPTTGCIVSTYGYIRERNERKLWETCRDIPFEDRTYRAISDYHTYLRRLYGDYMTPPPPENRVPTHFHKLYKIL